MTTPRISILGPAALLAAWTIAICPASGDTLLSTDFTGRTVSGRTASNISWTTSGVQDPGNLTWVNAGAGPTTTGLFDTPDAQGHFAPDLNIDNEGRIRWHWRFDTPEKYQTMMKNYYRLCTGVDTMCGRVLAELETQGVLDNTLVIFCGDNGYFHAEHGLADKWYPFQESIRVPLIIRDPRLPLADRGSTNDAYALNVDLAPTILAAAGIAEPAAMQGRDLTPLYLSTVPPAWRTEFFYEHPTISNINRIPSSQALVRRDWKYFYWPDYTTEQLFDLEADPIEEDDRITDPAQATRLGQMRTRFNELKAAAQ